jgi:Tfp pilus assembly protein PilF
MLRSAGIKAYVKVETIHAYVLIVSGGKTYKLDPTQLIIEPSKEVPCSDRKAISMQYANQFTKDNSDALKNINAALEIDPNNATAWNLKGYVYSSQEKLKEACDCYLKAVRCDSSFAIAFNNLGSKLNDLGKPDEALKFLLIAIKLNSQLAGAIYNAGVSYALIGDHDNAVLFFRAALQMDPALADSSNLEDLAAINNAGWSRAMTFLEQAKALENIQ